MEITLLSDHRHDGNVASVVMILPCIIFITCDESRLQCWNLHRIAIKKIKSYHQYISLAIKSNNIIICRRESRGDISPVLSTCYNHFIPI